MTKSVYERITKGSLAFSSSTLNVYIPPLPSMFPIGLYLKVLKTATILLLVFTDPAVAEEMKVETNGFARTHINPIPHNPEF